MITKYWDYIRFLESKMDISLFQKGIKNVNIIINEETENKFYNCFAYSLGIKDRYIIHTHIEFWVNSVPQTGSIFNYIKLYEYFGFEKSDSSFEEGYKKIVIYGNKGFALHAAIQLDDIWYESKFGKFEIGKHTLESIEGTLYGFPKIWMKKKL